jgi:hypothetical protein
MEMIEDHKSKHGEKDRTIFEMRNLAKEKDAADEKIVALISEINRLTGLITHH